MPQCNFLPTTMLQGLMLQTTLKATQNYDEDRENPSHPTYF